MKRMFWLLWICLFTVTMGFAAETNLTLTIDGITYNNVRFVHPTPATVTVFHSTGVATIPLAKLPPDLQKQFNYDPQEAARWGAAEQKLDAEVAEAKKQELARWKTAQEKAAAEAAALEDAQRKAAAALQWTLRVQSVLPDGVIAWGCQGATPNGSNSMTILLMNPPGLHDLAEGEHITATAYRDGNAQVQTRTLEKWVCLPSASPAVAEESRSQPPQAPATGFDAVFPDLHNTGAFGFPQPKAKILCNRSVLRFSVWNNDQYLFAQAVLWTDDDSSVGKDEKGNALGDYSHLNLDLDDNGTVTPNVDRVYWLNQRPFVPGLRYVVCRENGATTGAKDDSGGRGCIRYVKADVPNRVRVDTYLIPLQELGKRVGDTIGISFYAWSPKPSLSVNSVDFTDYRPHTYTQYVLTQGVPIDPTLVPDGRNDKLPSE